MEPPHDPQTGRRARARALIVEDDEDTRELYAWCLRAAGWFVEEVTGGAEALLAAATSGPDVIVMDLHMPGQGGLETIVRLRRHEATKDIPIVVCTGFDGKQSEIDARAVGCDAFVVKPCEPEVLRGLLEELVAGRRRSRE